MSNFTFQPLTINTVIQPEDVVSSGRLNEIDGLNIVKKHIAFMPPGQDVKIGYNYWIRHRMADEIAAVSFSYRHTSGQISEVRFTEPYVGQPQMADGSKLYPAWARSNALSYEAPVYATPRLYAPGTNTLLPMRTGSGFGANPLKAIELFKMPIPVLTDPCNLTGLTPEELDRVGHNPLDPGTYFIIRGNPTNMLLVERLRGGVIHIKPGRKAADLNEARQILSDNTGTSLTNIFKLKDHNYVFSCAALGKVTSSTVTRVVYNRMNVISMALIIGIFYHDNDTNFSTNEQDIYNLFESYLHAYMPYSENNLAWSQIRAEFLSAKSLCIRPGQAFNILCEWLNIRGASSDVQARTIHNMIDRNVYVTAGGRREKIAMLAIQTCKLMAFEVGIIPASDLNSWAECMLETPVVRLSLSMRKGLQLLTTKLQSYFPLEKSGGHTDSAVYTHMIGELHILTTKMYSQFRVQTIADEKRPPLTQLLSYDNIVSLMVLNNKIHVKSFKRSNSMKPRNVHALSPYRVCPAHTPDDSRCGLVRYKTPLSVVCPGVSNPAPLSQLVSHGYISYSASADKPYPVLFNGIPVGFCSGVRAQQEIALTRRKYRFDGGSTSILDEYACVVFNHDRHLNIFTEGNRVVRPVLYVTNNLILLPKAEEHISFTEMVDRGYAGYLDAREEEYELVPARVLDLPLRVASSEAKFERLRELTAAQQTTSLEYRNLQAEIAIINKFPIRYCSLQGIEQYDIAASLLVFKQNEQLCRITSGAKYMGQAMGPDSTPWLHEKGCFLGFCNQPLVETSMSESYGLHRSPVGHNALAAACSVNLNQEDAIVISKSFLEISGAYSYVRRIVKTANLDNRDSDGYKVVLRIPPKKAKNNPEPYRHINRNDGLPAKNVEYKRGDCVLALVITVVKLI
jgi:DNA-directed RNA polymerase subunit B